MMSNSTALIVYLIILLLVRGLFKFCRMIVALRILCVSVVTVLCLLIVDRLVVGYWDKFVVIVFITTSFCSLFVVTILELILFLFGKVFLKFKKKREDSNSSK